MKLILAIIAALILISCTKEYIEHPSCYRYLELSYKWTGDMIPIQGHFPDTIYSASRYNNIVCGNDTLRLISDAKPTGCPTGYKQTIYVILKP